jgi:hypothetical protein
MLAGWLYKAKLIIILVTNIKVRCLLKIARKIKGFKINVWL